MAKLTKTTIARAEVGAWYSIRRGRRTEVLGRLVTKERNPRGYSVRFETGPGLEGLTYNGFAGGATVVLRHDAAVAA